MAIPEENTPTEEQQHQEAECSWCNIAKIVAGGVALAGVGIYGGYQLGSAARRKSLVNQPTVKVPAIEM